MIESRENLEDKSLPLICLEEIKEAPLERGGVSKAFNIRNEEGLTIGECVVDIKERTVQMSAISIIPDYRRKGYGKAAYLEIGKQFSDCKFTSDRYNSLSDDAKGVWESLIKDGLAHKTENGYAMEEEENGET